MSTDYGGITTNPAEGYFSQLKRLIDGTHRRVSTVHLQAVQTDRLGADARTDRARRGTAADLQATDRRERVRHAHAEWSLDS